MANPELHPLFDTLDRYDANLDPVAYPTLWSFLQRCGNAAVQDFRLAHEFLTKHDGAKGTFNLYRADVSRLLLFIWQIEGRSLAVLDTEMLERYIDFVRAPIPEWIGRANYPGYVDNQGVRVKNDKWRPFVNRQRFSAQKPGADIPPYQLSSASLNATITSLRTFCLFLVRRKVVFDDPFEGVSKKFITSVSASAESHNIPTGQRRRLGDDQWAEAVEVLTELAAVKPALERELFVVITMKALFLRVSELAPWPSPRGLERIPTFGNFQFREVQGDAGWIFCTRGKGRKYREISVPDGYLPYLIRYRQWRGLSPLPEPGEPDYLLVGRSGQPLSRRQVTRVITNAFLEIADHLENTDPAAQARSRAFRAMANSTHYLRHTGASMAIDPEDPETLRYISEELGHGNPNFTDEIYMGSDQTRRHRFGRKRRV